MSGEQSVACLETFPVLLVPASIVPAALVVPTAAVIDANAHQFRVHAVGVGKLELQPRIVIFEKVGGVIDIKELDEADPPSSLVVPQAHHLDILGVKHLRVGRHACEAVEDVVLGRIVGQPLDDDGG